MGRGPACHARPARLPNAARWTGTSGQVNTDFTDISYSGKNKRQGKKFAGQTIMLDEIQTGVWVIKPGRFIFFLSTMHAFTLHLISP
jgi:hypothetical protein